MYMCDRTYRLECWSPLKSLSSNLRRECVTSDTPSFGMVATNSSWGRRWTVLSMTIPRTESVSQEANKGEPMPTFYIPARARIFVTSHIRKLSSNCSHVHHTKIKNFHTLYRLAHKISISLFSLLRVQEYVSQLLLLLLSESCWHQILTHTAITDGEWRGYRLSHIWHGVMHTKLLKHMFKISLYVCVHNVVSEV